MRERGRVRRSYWGGREGEERKRREGEERVRRGRLGKEGGRESDKEKLVRKGD